MWNYLIIFLFLLSCNQELNLARSKFNDLKMQKLNLFSKKETVYVQSPIVVNGIFDGKFKHYKWVGDGDCSQREDMPPMFKILQNSVLKNVSIEGAPDGIHIYGDNVKITNIVIDDVCEDAISAKGIRSNIVVESSYFGKCEDKGIQLSTEINKVSDVLLEGNLFEDCTCAIRIKENDGVVNIQNNFFVKSHFGVRTNLSKNIRISNNYFIDTYKAFFNEESTVYTFKNYLLKSNK